MRRELVGGMPDRYAAILTNLINMKRIALLVLILVLPFGPTMNGQSWAYGDHWYNNPLGFHPIELHAKNGFLIPAAAVGICLLVTKTDSQFVNGIGYYNESGISWGYKYPYTTLSQNNTGAQIFLRQWLSIGVDIGFYFPRDAFNNTVGIALRPFARFYPIKRDSWKMFFESGGGLIYFIEQFPKPTDQDPRQGTNWNGTTRYGVGSEITLGGITSFLFGIRHIHISNGNIKGVERNPSHDSNGIFIGLSFYTGNRISFHEDGA